MRRMQIRRLVMGPVLAAGMSLGIFVTPANATSFASLTVEQFTDASSWIVRGTVDEIWTERGENGYIWTRARLTVSTVYKGERRTNSIIVDSIGGEFEGERLHVPGQAIFSVGEETLVFLASGGHEGSRLVPVSKFLGTQIIRRAPGDSEKYVTTFHPDKAITFDARFLPHPKPESRVYLSDLVDRIEARLDVGWDGKDIPGISATELRKINTLDRRFRR